jgi:hypothetical protein
MVFVSVQDRFTVCAKCTIGLEIVLDVPDGTLGDEALLEACFSPFRDSANLEYDRRTVCDKSTIGSKIILDAPDGTPRFDQFRDGAWQNQPSYMAHVHLSLS